MPAAPQQSRGRRSTGSRRAGGTAQRRPWPPGPQSYTMPPPSLASGGFLPGALHRSDGRRDGSGHGGTGSARSAVVGLLQRGRPSRQSLDQCPSPASAREEERERGRERERERESNLTCAVVGQQPTIGQLARWRWPASGAASAAAACAPAMARRPAGSQPCVARRPTRGGAPALHRHAGGHPRRRAEQGEGTRSTPPRQGPCWWAALP
jgi:hypothetical protein